MPKTKAHNFFVGQTIKLSIDHISFNGGRGVARSEGFVFFVPFTAPGDIIEAKITTLKKSYGEAEKISLLQASPQRATPPCPVYQRCGGCQLQHLQYSSQVEQKKQILQNALARGLNLKNLVVNEFHPSPKPFHYRRRIQVHIKNQKYGFLQFSTHSFIPFQECWIAEEKINVYLKQQQQFEHEKIEVLSFPNQPTVSYPLHHKSDQAYFSQVNPEVNERLLQTLLRLTGPLSLKKILDLYCGSGNYTHPLALQNPESTLTGVESSQRLINEAQSLTSTKKLQFVCSSVENYVGQATHALRDLDLVLLNPPRTGLSKKVTQPLLLSSPHHLIYISCNPTTLARDLLPWLKNYQIQHVIGFDMFPQTYHMECLVHLSKKSI